MEGRRSKHYSQWGLAFRKKEPGAVERWSGKRRGSGGRDDATSHSRHWADASYATRRPHEIADLPVDTWRDEVAPVVRPCGNPLAKGSKMLSLLPHRRARIERIEAEAVALIRDFRDEAYSEARRREQEASFDAPAKYWGRVALAIAHKTGKRDDLHLTTRMAINAVPALDREPAAAREPRRPDGEPKPVAEPRVVLLRRPQLFRI